MGDDVDAEIKRILSSRNLYETLGVPRNVEEDELKRQYKRVCALGVSVKSMRSAFESLTKQTKMTNLG